jgi:hypothetical protein
MRGVPVVRKVAAVRASAGCEGVGGGRGGSIGGVLLLLSLEVRRESERRLSGAQRVAWVAAVRGGGVRLRPVCFWR